MSAQEAKHYQDKMSSTAFPHAVFNQALLVASTDRARDWLRMFYFPYLDPSEIWKNGGWIGMFCREDSGISSPGRVYLLAFLGKAVVSAFPGCLMHYDTLFARIRWLVGSSNGDGSS